MSNINANMYQCVQHKSHLYACCSVNTQACMPTALCNELMQAIFAVVIYQIIGQLLAETWFVAINSFFEISLYQGVRSRVDAWWDLVTCMPVALLLQLLEQVYNCNVICLDILSSLGHMTITACHLSAKQKTRAYLIFIDCASLYVMNNNCIITRR